MRSVIIILCVLFFANTSCKKEDDNVGGASLRITIDRGVYPVHDATVRLYSNTTDYQTGSNWIDSKQSIKFNDNDDAYVDFEGLEQQVYYFSILSENSPWGHNNPSPCSGSSSIKNSTNGALVVGDNDVLTRLCYN